MKTQSSLLKKIAAAVCFIFICVIVTSCALGQSLVNSVLCGYSLRKIPIYNVERDDKLISISFDCAWGNEHTQTLLDEMSKYGVVSTFFMVSFWTEKYPNDVKKIAELGHEIGTHSKTHSYMSKQTKEQINLELEYSTEVIENLTGAKVRLFRPPYGDYDDLLIECAQNKGLYTIQWDVDSLDWKGLSANEIALRVISKVKSGSIILCHNNGEHTAESLALIFSDLIGKGYKFVKISDLIYKDNYKISANGTQMKTD